MQEVRNVKSIYYRVLRSNYQVAMSQLIILAISDPIH